MAVLAYPFEVRDSTNATTDNRKTGLAPTVSDGKTIAASPATVLASTVTIVEVVGGHYAALYDAEANGDAAFPIDCGASLGNPNDRYLTLDLTREPGRILGGVILDGGSVSASPAPSTTTFTASGANLHGGSPGYAGQQVRFSSGSLRGQRFPVAGHAASGSNHAFTVAAMPAPPAAGDTFDIL